MSIALVVDMNLTPEWVPFFQNVGLTAIHWSDCGPINAPDSVIMDWADKNHHVVFTLDLDFTHALAMTHATAPSVLQVRGARVLWSSSNLPRVAFVYSRFEMRSRT